MQYMEVPYLNAIHTMSECPYQKKGGQKAVLIFTPPVTKPHPGPGDPCQEK